MHQSYYIRRETLTYVWNFETTLSQYKLPLCLLFIDYEKAFDSVELNAALRALVVQVVDANYVESIKCTNTGCSTDIKLFHRDL